ncbi:MAG: glycosyltransferase family 2 protein [Planctomycetaceae bacterium]|nr:glycosyltransferase family 2 protein [Planctomycetaceae bacterium]
MTPLSTVADGTSPADNTASGRDRRQAKLSVVLPVYNEQAVLRELTLQLNEVLLPACGAVEIVYVNDGSSDGSRELLNELAAEFPHIVVVHLARNFGHQPALHAGLCHADGDAVVVMDSDMQDDPRALLAFLSQWEQGFDVVYAQRTDRKESLLKRALFFSFYRVLNTIADSAMPEDAGNFGLMDRRVVSAITDLQEHERYFPGLRSWTGFRQTGIPVARLARHDGEPRVSMAGLFKLAKTAIFAFSSFPLKLFYVIAAISCLVCMASMGFVLYHKTMTGLAIPGWTSIISTASFFGALNALGISVLGEYVIRIYDEVRRRPIYLTEQVIRNGKRCGPESGLPVPAMARRGAVRSDSDISQTLDDVLADVDSEWNQSRPTETTH